MRDVELYRHLLGLETPWTVRSVELSIQEQRVDVWRATPRTSAGRVPSAGPWWGSMITPKNACGGISTAACPFRLSILSAPGGTMGRWRSGAPLLTPGGH